MPIDLVCDRSGVVQGDDRITRHPAPITIDPFAEIDMKQFGQGGLQIVGRFRDEASVLRAAALYEASEEWLSRWPSL